MNHPNEIELPKIVHDNTGKAWCGELWARIIYNDAGEPLYSDVDVVPWGKAITADKLQRIAAIVAEGRPRTQDAPVVDGFKRQNPD